MMWGCEQVRDWNRAGEWCQRVKQFRHRADWLGSPYALCRAHYGVILLWRGEWAAAETELRRAADDLAVQRPWLPPRVKGEPVPVGSQPPRWSKPAVPRTRSVA